MIRIPEHITESEILALIEGDMGSIPFDRRDAVRDAVAGDPELSRLVSQVRADSTAVVSLSQVSAPAVIRAKVIEDLRRPMPRPDYVREPAGGEIPVSSVVVRRESKWRRRLESVPFRQLATAASLALAAGLGVVLIRSASKLASTHTPGPVALVPRATRPVASPDPELDAFPIDITPGASVAVNRADPSSMTSPPLLTDEYGFATALKSDHPLASDDGLLAPAAKSIPADEAVALARTGQLIIRVRAIDEKDAHEKIDQFAMRSPKELKWRPLEAWELSEVASAFKTKPIPPTPYAGDKPPAKAHEAPDALKIPEADKPAPVVKPIGVSADVAAALRDDDFHPVYTVEMDENERDLAAMLEKLTDGKKQVAEFVALENPLPTLMPSTDPAAVLWWTRPPSNWTRRICVPIVLETVH